MKWKEQEILMENEMENWGQDRFVAALPVWFD